MRLDKFLQLRFGLRSRTYAENLILTGEVLVDGQVAKKPALDVDENNDIKILSDLDYASQGAYKLEEALQKFRIDVTGLYAVDLGCSNGGFCDVLIRHGIGRITAVDVGENALADSVKNSGKVTFLKANARELPLEAECADFVCADLSFISQKYVLPEIFRILKKGGEAVTLVKPQFELDKNCLAKSGVVTDEKLRARALKEVSSFAETCGFFVKGTTISPVRYADKNIEYLLCLEKPFLT